MAKNETQAHDSVGVEAVVLEAPGKSIYESLCEKINLKPVTATRPVESYQDVDELSGSSLDERVTQAMHVFLNMIKHSSQQVDRLDKSLLDFHIAQLDEQISQQLDAIMHHEIFQKIESAWRGLKFLVDAPIFARTSKLKCSMCQKMRYDRTSKIRPS